jgi:hypothetical protein
MSVMQNTNHLDVLVDKLNSSKQELEDYADSCDPADTESWEEIFKLTQTTAAASFTAQQEFRLEHFLAKNLISSI